jgi:hypothetical protein
MNMVLLAALALAAPEQSPEWAPIAITEGDSPTLFFIDRTSIKATADGSSARTFVASDGAVLRLHVEYDCGGERYRYLDSAMPADAPPGSPQATRWAAIKPDSPLNPMMRYACSGGKVDFGFGDLAIKSPSPEAFAREFLARRAAAKRK